MQILAQNYIHQQTISHDPHSDIILLHTEEGDDPLDLGWKESRNSVSNSRTKQRSSDTSGEGLELEAERREQAKVSK